jgi:enoyl-CoA hydratase/carnithine racemase
MRGAARSFRYAVADGVALVTLDRPDRLNALTFEMYEELTALFGSFGESGSLARADPAVPAPRAIVITGAGRGFCSGGDHEAIIAPLLDATTPQLLAFTRLTCALIRNMRTCPLPIVAAINGVAAGAGAVIALASDFRVGSERSRFGFVFTKVGLAGADMGAAWLLPKVVGLARATEWLMLGDLVSAEDAHRAGLLHRLVAQEAVVDEARALAMKLAAGPAFALGLTKSLLNGSAAMTLEAGLEAEAQGQALCMQHPDFREGYRAFAEKRPPRFT